MNLFRSVRVGCELVEDLCDLEAAMTTKYTLRALCIAVALAVPAFFSCWQVEAGSRQMLHGLFCNTEKQIDDTVAFIRMDLPLETAIAIANNDKIECVLAKDIRFVVVDPVAQKNIKVFF